LPHDYTDAIVVPQNVTFELQDKVYVYKVVDGKATSAMIDVEKVSDGREYVVRSGIEAGDMIVAEGVGLMREGTPITPKGQAAAAQTETGKEE
jgi:membrane fusion protein (multidrug efflux system)